MQAIQQLENGQNAPTIRQSVFNNVMGFCKCDTGDDVETIGMMAQNFGYVISFYGTVQSNYDLIVEEFGCFQNGDWVECEPTEEQMDKMKLVLAKEIQRINTLIEEDALEEARALQEEADEMRYGHPGAIYGKWY